MEISILCILIRKCLWGEAKQNIAWILSFSLNLQFCFSQLENESICLSFLWLTMWRKHFLQRESYRLSKVQQGWGAIWNISFMSEKVVTSSSCFPWLSVVSVAFSQRETWRRQRKTWTFQFENRAKSHPIPKGKCWFWFPAVAWKLKCRAFHNFVSLRNFPWENLPVFNQLFKLPMSLKPPLTTCSMAEAT